LKLNDFKTTRISANYKKPVKKRIKSYVPNSCSLIKLLLRRTLVLPVILFSFLFLAKWTILTFHNIYLTDMEFNITSYSLNLCSRIGRIYGSVSK